MGIVVTTGGEVSGDRDVVNQRHDDDLLDRRAKCGNWMRISCTRLRPRRASPATSTPPSSPATLAPSTSLPGSLPAARGQLGAELCRPLEDAGRHAVRRDRWEERRRFANGRPTAARRRWWGSSWWRFFTWLYWRLLRHARRLLVFSLGACAGARGEVEVNLPLCTVPEMR